MKSVIDLYRELESLPKGYISKKKIKGKTYFYLQFVKNNKIYSRYIKASELSQIIFLLKRRKKIENEIRHLRKRNSSLTLSKNAVALNGFVMMGDEKVAQYQNGNLVEINRKKAPLYLVRTGNIEEYLKSRTLDLTRPNARILLKTLNIQDKEKIIALYAHGATISDNYWFKALGSKLKYHDIYFSNDQYSDLALKGKIIPLRQLGSPSPELTAIGSFEKCWKIINNEWWLYKAGQEDNIFSELFSAKFAELLGIPSAIYEYDSGYIRSKNFADKLNFEPMFAICGDNEEYDFVFAKLLEISPTIAQAYINLLIFDAITYNVDRHNQNYGLMRNKKTGEIISLAPNFDNNMSLFAYNHTLNQDVKNDGLIKLLVAFLTKNPKAQKLFKNIRLPDITKKDLLAILNAIPIKRDNTLIISFILNRLYYFKKMQDNL
ncbi:MAG: hypothetical protein MJ206_00510 [Bacilli bacterium]|nr:hypothetical protein [Bacilli bacterium]